MTENANRKMWRDWWEAATPEQREWAKAASGQPWALHELREDDEDMPTGVRKTDGMFPDIGFLFGEEKGEDDD